MAIEYVPQRDKHGCVIACLAMVTGRDYWEIKTCIGVDVTETGVPTWRWADYLGSTGYLLAPRSMSGLHKGLWPCSAFADVHLCTVKVDKDAKYTHLVVVLRDGTVLDPDIPGPRTLDDYVRVYGICGVWPLGKYCEQE